MAKRLLLLLVVIMIDQLTKAVFPPPPCPQCSAGPELLNNDFVLGYLPGGGRLTYVLVMLAAIVLVWVAAPPPVAAGLIIGGAIGNLIDLVLLDGVRDWLGLGPAYWNVADLAMIAGGLLWAFKPKTSTHGEEVACSDTP